jgi:hypothetical protein
MTPEQIETLFWETINKKEAYGEAIYNKLEGITENQIYNWRKGRGKKPSQGDMLNVLYQLNLVKVDKITAQDIEMKKAWDAWGEKEEALDSGSTPSLNIHWSDNPIFKDADKLDKIIDVLEKARLKGKK